MSYSNRFSTLGNEKISTKKKKDSKQKKWKLDSCSDSFAYQRVNKDITIMNHVVDTLENENHNLSVQDSKELNTENESNLNHVSKDNISNEDLRSLYLKQADVLFNLEKNRIAFSSLSDQCHSLLKMAKLLNWKCVVVFVFLSEFSSKEFGSTTKYMLWINPKAAASTNARTPCI